MLYLKFKNFEKFGTFHIHAYIGLELLRSICMWWLIFRYACHGIELLRNTCGVNTCAGL